MPGNMQYINTVEEFFDEDYDTGEHSITQEQYTPTMPPSSWFEYGNSVVKKDRAARRLAALTTPAPAPVSAGSVCIVCGANRAYGIWCKQHAPHNLRCTGVNSNGNRCANRPQPSKLRCGHHLNQVVADPVITPPIVREERIMQDNEDVGEIVLKALASIGDTSDHFIVAGTGSRSVQSASPAGKQQLLKWLEVLLTRTRENHPNLIVMSGMAEGFDKALAVTALKLNIPLWCAIPSKDYGQYYWGRNSITGYNMLHQYQEILNRATYVTYVMPTPAGSAKYGRRYGMANFDRNDFMVAVADAFVVYDPKSSGTHHCVAAIRESGKPFKVAPLVQ